MNEDVDRSGIAKDFLINWAMVLISGMVAVAVLVGFVLIVLLVALWPLLLGQWVEFGILPWQSRDVPLSSVGSFWLLSAVVWMVFLLSGIVAAVLTSEESEDNE